MARCWLKAIGTSDRPCTGLGGDEVHFSVAHDGSHVQPGDLLVLYAVGRGATFFGIVEVSGPRRHRPKQPDDRWPYEFPIKRRVIVAIKGAPKVERIWSGPFKGSQMQRGCIAMTAERFARADALLRSQPNAEITA